MDATPCGRFELAFKFKLFTVVGSVSGPYQVFLFFCLAVLVQLGIYLSGPCLILPYISIVLLLPCVAHESRSSFS